MANKSFPYNEIANDRRFEELLYSIVKSKIENDSFYKFDQVGLMTGVRDKGRDCVLLKNGKNHGLIQCKKYNDNLSKTAFGEEITKFVLYSLIEPELIYNPKDFTYFIAVSTGFVITCSNFIDDFSTKIGIEPDLDKWINKNIQNPTLASLKLMPPKELREKATGIFSQIKVRKLLPTDLDSYLSEPNLQHISSLYFELRTVTDNSVIHSAIKKLQENLSASLSMALNQQQIKEELQQGSSGLRFEHNTFDELPNSHISRTETADLLNWIRADAELDNKGRPLNLILLAGNAGMGKTVILKDLLDSLTEQNVPTLGLKADKLVISNLTDLQQQTGLSVPVHDFIRQCKQQFEKTVLIIDQIDALSQSMSADRSALLVFKLFIDKYIYDPNIRIIVSVRIHDLHYDPSLRSYKDVKSIIVASLKDTDVYEVLSTIGISKDNISTKLLELLKTPNNLNVFSRIANHYEGWRGITSIQELYLELWRQKVLNPLPEAVNAQDVKALLYNISAQMFKANRISISVNMFENDIRSLNYLESELLVKREDGRLQFFHQTFYDFVFAKSFVEKDSDLISYLKEHEQAIQIRSAVKMIVGYMRNYDQDKYLQILKHLFEDTSIYFHIKQMLISGLAFQDIPLQGEIDLLLNVVTANPDLQISVLESFSSKYWTPLILHHVVIPTLKNNETEIAIASKEWGIKNNKQYWYKLTLGFLYRCINDNIEEAWNYILNSKNAAICTGVLSYRRNWEDEKAMWLFDKYETDLKEDNHTYIRVLEDIAKTKPEFAWNRIREQLMSDNYGEKNTHTDYEEYPILKSLAKVIPEKLIADLYTISEQNLDKENILNEKIINDWRLSSIDLQDKDNLNGKEYLYRLLAVCLRRAAAKKAPEFIDFLNVHQYSIYKAVLRIIVFALKTNEQQYAKYIYSLFVHLLENDHIKSGSYFSVEFREVLQEGFPFMTPDEQCHISSAIKHLIVKKELWIYRGGEKPYRMGKWGLGRYAYLLRLPKSFIERDKELREIAQESERKFPNFKEIQNNTRPILAGVVRRPLSQQAYQKMSEKQWIASFKKYNKDSFRSGEDFLKGGLHEHSWAFKESVMNEPIPIKFRLIEAVIDDPELPISYAILGLLGLVEGKASQKDILPLFKKLLDTNRYHIELRLCITIAGYLIGEENDDPQIVAFLIEQALTIDSPEKEQVVDAETGINGLITHAMNTIHGSAAGKLAYIIDKQYEEKVFETVVHLLKFGPRESRAILLYKLAYLNRMNIQRAFGLFVNTLNEEDDIFILASSIWSLQYMASHNFESLIPIYEKLISATNLGKEDMKGLVNLIYSALVYHSPGAEPLMYKLIDNHSKSHQNLLRVITKHFYLHEDTPAISIPLLIHILELPENKKSEKFQLYFDNIDHVNLLDIHNFLESYIQSSHFNLTDQFISYITQQCGQYPLQSISLFNLAMSEVSKEEDYIEDNGYLRTSKFDNISKFIIGAYNSIKGSDAESKQQRKQLLEAFDSILKDFRYRQNNEKILEDLV